MRRWGFALAVLGLALGGGIEASAAAQGRAPADPQANPEPAPSPQLEQPASSAQSVPDPASIKLVAAQFVDLPLSGGSTSDAQYGLKLDAYVDLKGSLFGLDDSFALHIHPELRAGESSNGEIGLLPTNSALFYPASEDEQFDLSANLTKTWRSGASLTVGKVNVFDLSAQLPITGGGGIEGFQNLAFALPPSAIVPGSLVGALLTVPTKKALFRLWVFDPNLASRRSGIPTLFEDGVGALASVTVPATIAGRQGYYALKLAASTRRGISSRALPPVLIPAPGAGFGESRGEFAAILAASQYLVGGPRDPAGGIGVFGQVYLSAGDPTFLDVSAQAGIAGNPPGRPQDRFGLGWFRYSLTDRLVDALAARVPLEDEEGVEAFYTIGLNETFRLTANLQLIDSAIAPRDEALLGGLRLVTAF